MANAKRGRGVGMVNTVSPEKQTASVAEAAEMCGISERHLYELIRRDEFPVPTLRLGRRVVVPLAPLLRFLAGEGDTAA